MKKVLIVTLLFVVGLLLADEVTSSIDKAKSHYQSKKYSEAINELNYAVNQIQQIQLERYKTVFPAALSDWKAEEFQMDNAGMAFLGGGLSISRKYSLIIQVEGLDEKGRDSYYDKKKSVDISIVSDSPLLSSVMMMFSNPMFLGGNKMVTINGEKAIEQRDSDGKPDELQFVIENRVMVTVSGRNCSKEDLYGYAQKIDFAKLKSFLKE